MKKINIKISALLLIIVFVLAPIAPLDYIARSQVIDANGIEHIVGYQEWTTNREISNLIIVDVGATLVINKGVTVTFNDGTLAVEGNLFTKGTLKENVNFRKADGSNNYLVTVTGKMVMRNTDVSGGGKEVSIIGKNTLFNVAQAGFMGGITVNGGILDAEGCNFHDNEVAISGGYGGVLKVNRSKFINNSLLDVAYSEINGNSDFKYNWWGSASGPTRICYAPSNCYYEKIEGTVDFSNWLAQPDFKDPVIIIPGILGSWEKDGQLRIDPIFHTYDNLINEFISNGYVLNVNLFTFPYEWRDSNVGNAKKLKTKITEIKLAQNWPKVDLVAHSMGGLLAREYIESTDYANDVDQLITLATPNLGAPEAYVKWDGDGWFFNSVDIYMKHILKQEAREGGFADIFDYIHNRPMLSVKELLPVYNYLYEADNSNKLRIYPTNYPINEFLENINNISEKLNYIGYDKIIGSLNDNEAAINGFTVVSADMGKYWIHGYPLGFEIPATNRGAVRSNGDGTVPIESARSESIKSDNLIELQSDHQSIVTDAQLDVLELLTNVRPTTEVKKGLIRRMLMAQVFSPVDIQIVSPSGKRIGKNFETGEILNEIEDAYYTGFGTISEFITIPNPEDGDYRVLTQGTGDGVYKVEMINIVEDLVTGQASESGRAINGTALVGQQTEAVLQVQGNEVSGGDAIVEDPLDYSSVATTIDSIINDVDKYFEQDLIKNIYTKRYLLARLDNINKSIKKLADIRTSDRKDKYKERLEALRKKQINREVDRLIEKIKDWSRRYDDKYDVRKDRNHFVIIQPARGLLIENLEKIKY